MFKAKAWIERVQTETLFSETFVEREDAETFIKEDFLTRSSDKEFLQYGGYDIYEQTWIRIVRPEIVREPSLRFE